MIYPYLWIHHVCAFFAFTANDGIAASFVATECMVDQFAHLTSISSVGGILPLHPTVPGCTLTGGGSRDAVAACHV